MSLHVCYISIGSNIGDRLRHCCEAIAALQTDDTIRVVARSPFYETEPVDYLDQAWFLNAAIKVATSLAPMELLHRLQGIQATAGRKTDGVRFGPRVLDLDIILYDQMVMRLPELTIPHERMHKRRFVLQPIYDIDPNVVHPVLQLDVTSLLAELKQEGQTIRRCSYGC